MKKILMLMIVAVLMLGVSGQAMASFDQGDLIRVIYNNTLNGTGNEVAADLGAFSTTAPDSSYLNYNVNNFNLASVGASNWGQVSVAYFVMDGNANGGNGAAYTSGPTSGGGSVNLNGFWGSFNGAAYNTLAGYQAAAGGASSVTMSQSNGGSYWQNLNSAGSTQGLMSGWSKVNTEANLAALSTAGYVDQILYYYGTDPDNTITGTNAATLRTTALGSTVINPLNGPTTPIPAAVYLFGSGLMGLVGLRRKMA